MVEFMLVLPVLLLIVLGVIEAGRMMLIYSGMTSASREASRYGATVGDNGAGIPRYLDCAGMRAAARRLATLTTLADGDIQIMYDHGDTSSLIATCDSNPHPNQINLGDRVVVTISTVYQPIVPIVPLPPMTITTSTGRTILTEIAAGPTVTMGGPTSTSTVAPTSTAGPSPTTGPTATATTPPTNTPGPSPTATVTRTPIPSPTPIPAPQNFAASVQCSSPYKVSFTWTAVPGVDAYNIYKLVDGNPVQIAIDSNPPCNNCGTIVSGEVATYFVKATVLGRESPMSNTVTVSCGG